MCVVSMIMDHQYDEWERKFPPFREWPVNPNRPSIPLPPPIIMPIGPTQDEIDEFHRLLERAREYDKKNNEPDCELETKKEKLLKLAKELGIYKKVKEILDAKRS